MSQFISFSEPLKNKILDEPVVSKKSSKKKSSITDTLSQIQAKLFSAGISKSTIIKAPIITLCDGVKVNYTGGTDTETIRCCVWCRNQINNLRYGVPLWHDSSTNKWSCEGTFCSFNCTYSYILHQKSIKYKDSLGYFYIILDKLGLQLEEIVPARHWSEQQHFGGNLSIIEYKENFSYCPENRVEDYKNLIYICSKVVFGN